MSLEERNDFVEAPNMIANPCFHRWRYSQRLMNPAKVVVHVIAGRNDSQRRNVREQESGRLVRPGKDKRGVDLIC
jgi:hypothetical protein